MHKIDETAHRYELALLFLLGGLWGLPYALTKIALATIPPLTMVAARVSLAAIVLWIVVLAFGCRWPTRRGLVLRFFIQGCLACVLPYTLLAFGQHLVDSALTAILNSTTPIFVYIASLVGKRQDAPGLAGLFGISIGIVGVAVVAGAGALSGLGHSASGEGAIILGTVASAASVIHGRRFADVAPPITAAGTLTAGALVLVPLCFIVEAPLRSAPSWASTAALAANGVIVTTFGFSLYFRLIRTIGSMATASASYLKPAVGVLIGCTLMGESLTWTAAVGLMAILIGVAMISKSGSSLGRASVFAKLALRGSATN